MRPGAGSSNPTGENLEKLNVEKLTFLLVHVISLRWSATIVATINKPVNSSTDSPCRTLHVIGGGPCAGSCVNATGLMPHS